MAALSTAELAALARKYFPESEIQKVLYLINGESGGRPDAVGDGGAAYGLFQSHYVPKGASVEQQFADAARLYQNNLRNGGTGYGDWGEGTLYQGKPFGALGNHPYNGPSGGGAAAGGTSMPTLAHQSGYDPDHAAKLKQAMASALDAIISAKTPSERTIASTAYQPIAKAYMDYEKQYMMPVGDVPQAQQDFQNSIALGDVDAKAAQAAYNRWAGITDRAINAAQTQIADTASRQKSIGDMQLASEKSLAPSLMPKSLVAGYNPDTTSNIIDAYFKKYSGEAPGGPVPYGGSGDIPPPPSLSDAVSGVRTNNGLPSGYGATAGLGDAETPQNAAPPPAPYSLPGADTSLQYLPGMTERGDTAAAPPEPSADHARATGPWSRITPPPAPIETPVYDPKAKWWKRVHAPSYAAGTLNHPGGPALVGEKGTETAIYPGGHMQPVGVYGPEMANLPAGTAVIPAGVPPEEAYAYSQIQQAAKQGANGPDMLAQQREADMRANDPQLMEKVKASLMKALAGMDAMSPPKTPTPYGGARDLFANLRPLAANAAQLQQAQAAPAGRR